MTVLGVAELREQRLQLVVAAVDVADDVERAHLLLAVGPQRRADDLDRVVGRDDVREAEALLLQVAQRAAQVACLAADDVRAKFGANVLKPGRLLDS